MTCWLCRLCYWLGDHAPDWAYARLMRWSLRLDDEGNCGEWGKL